MTLFKARWPGILIWFLVGLLVGTTATALAVAYLFLNPRMRGIPKQMVVSGEGYTVIVSQNTARIKHPPILWESRTKVKAVALTFDDGPDPNYTPRILDILKEKNVRATFFLVGREVEQHPDIVEREISEGHELENHSYSHPELEVETDAQIQNEIVKGGEAIEKMTGKKPKYFRPPKGLVGGEVFTIANANGYQVILWGITIEHSASKTPPEEANRVLKAIEPGMIILAHDGRLNRIKTVEALPIIIDGLRAKGYKFLTLSALLRLDKPAGRGVRLKETRSLRKQGKAK
ncbi:MAG: polysaccharide deacetylase family protein [Actinomycetota bacterium]